MDAAQRASRRSSSGILEGGGRIGKLSRTASELRGLEAQKREAMKNAHCGLCESRLVSVASSTERRMPMRCIIRLCTFDSLWWTEVSESTDDTTS